MRNLFNLNNPAIQFLGNIFNLILLNLFFILTSLPIITIGASLTALTTVTMKMAKGDDPYIVKGYFKAFKNNFKQSTLLWIPILIIIYLLEVDLTIIYKMLDKSLLFLQIPVFLLLFLVLCVIFYGFPLIGRYKNTLKQTVKNALLLGLSNVPTTIFFIVIPTLLVFLSNYSAAISVFLFSLTLFCGLALLAYIDSFFLLRVFYKCMGDEEKKALDSFEDEDDESSM